MRVGLEQAAGLAILALALASTACEDRYKDGAALSARAAVLRREVEGLRTIVSRLERHEPMMPPGDVSVAIDEALVRDIIVAQLPLDVDVEGYRVRLDKADVAFRGTPLVRLHGTLTTEGWMGLEAVVDAIGALDGLAVGREGSTLSARIAIDHLALQKAAGLERFLSGSNLGELSRMVRAAIADKLPQVQIPVRVQPTIDLPAVTTGAVRIDGASIPLNVAVSQVTPVRGSLWVALHLEPGEVK